MPRIIRASLLIILGIPGGVGVLWNVAFRLIDWLTRFDFFLQQTRDHGWVAAAVEAILNRPPPLGLLAFGSMAFLWAVVFLWGRQFPIKPIVRRIPLREAAISAYERRRKTEFMEAIEAAHTPREELLRHLEWVIFRKSDVYGSKPPSRLIEHIPEEERKKMKFVANGSSYLTAIKPASYENIVISRREYRKFLRYIDRASKWRS